MSSFSNSHSAMEALSTVHGRIIGCSRIFVSMAESLFKGQRKFISTGIEVESE